MTKNTIQDIKIKRDKVVWGLDKDNVKIEHKSNPIFKPTENKPKPKSNHRLWKFFAIVFLVVILLYFVGNFFENTKVDIVAQRKTFTLDQERFTASKSTNTPINFEIMITPGEISENFTLTESTNVSSKAKGVVTMYNENSTKPQKLLINTFLSDENGKTYKTNSAIAIPGYTKVGTKIVPGKIDVEVTAFLAGDSYNGSPSNFYVNGFKNTAKYKTIYGKAKTPISGGSSGLVYLLGPVEKGTLEARASTDLKASLMKKIEAQVPEGYLLYPGTEQFSYDSNENYSSPTQEAKVPISGTISAILLKQKDVSTAIIRNVLPGISDKELQEIQVQNLKDLVFKFTNPDQSIAKDMQSIDFNFSGDVKLLWQPDIESIKAKLVGVSKDKVSDIFKQDPGIDNASLKIFPFWKSSVSFDTSKISINLK
jgi:hypothetical protein